MPTAYLFHIFIAIDILWPSKEQTDEVYKIKI